MTESTETHERNEKAPDNGEQLQNETGNTGSAPAEPTTFEELARAGGVRPDSDALGSRELLQAERDAAEHAAGDDLGTYEAMFEQYRADQRSWLGPAQLPLVFHLAKLCRKLDANPDAPASLSSAYLQAFHRLERQRPGSKEPAGAAGDLPGQASIFDELD